MGRRAAAFRFRREGGSGYGEGRMKPSQTQPASAGSPPEAAPDRELSAQFAATRALADAESLEAAMPAILQAICENLGWLAGAYWVLERGGQALECRATWRPPDVPVEIEENTRATRFGKGEGLPGRVWESGKLLAIEIGEFESPRVLLALRHGLRGAFAYPIHGHGGYLGVIEFSSREVRQPDERLLAMLGSIESQVVQFLDRRRAIESTRFLSEASALLATSLDYELTLRRLAMLAVPFLGDWCAVDVAAKELPAVSGGRFFRRVAVAHVDPLRERLVREMQERWPPDPASPFGYPKVLRTGEPDFFPHTTAEQLRATARDPEHLVYLETLGYRSFICVPLSARGRVLGTMTFVIAGDDRRYELRDFELALDLARRAGQAVDNALLFQELERGRRSAALLAEASRVLASMPDVKRALQDVAQLVGADLGELVNFMLFDENGGYETVGWVDPAVAAVVDRLKELFQRLPPNTSIGVPRVLQTGKTDVFHDPDYEPMWAQAGLSEEQRANMRTFAARAGITVPLITRGGLFGVLAIRTSRPGRFYTPDEVELAEDIAQRAALAIENARLHRQAGEAVQARDEFLSVASHELRTPLTALHLLVRTLRPPDAGDDLPALTPEKLEIAERQIERIAKLVDQLFDLSRVTAGRLELELEDVDLSVVARDVTARMKDEAFESGCVVAVRAPAPAVGRWDRFRLEQIVTNLLSNALKYGRGKPVEIAVEDLGEEARLTVRDHGIGIAREHLNRIFERFSRANPGRRYDGLGLGLYIIRQILDAFGARVSVQSEPGEGALFVVELPKQVPAPPAAG